MISKIRLIRNIGTFDSVDAGANIELTRLVLIYAENARGKTTLVAVLRSLASDDPRLIAQRHRISVPNSPHVVLDFADSQRPTTFQSGKWEGVRSEFAFFGDDFIDRNIYSGLVVDAEHRRNLHEVILGAPGVTLNRDLHEAIAKIEEHNRTIRDRSAAIPTAERYGLSIDDFCSLPEVDHIDAEIEKARHRLLAAEEHDSIQQELLFDPIELPRFEVDTIANLLAQGLDDLDAAVAVGIRRHIEGLGRDSEPWIVRGMQFVEASGNNSSCPFCAQELRNSTLFAHYREHFGAAYSNLQSRLVEVLSRLHQQHSGEAQARFERDVRIMGERSQLWSRFCQLPDVSIDTEAIVRDWTLARELVLSALTLKQRSLLDEHVLHENARTAISVYEEQRRTIARLTNSLVESNVLLREIKEHSAGANAIDLRARLSRLYATRARHTLEISSLCDSYVQEVEAKSHTEQKRETAKAKLDEYRTHVFPESQATINKYLVKFGADFRLDNVTYTTRRSGPACTYSIVIRGSHISIASDTTRPGEPSFGTTLSSGDRNTLALAFFLASLDQDGDLANKVIVIDDPITSLDDQRSHTTVEAVHNLVDHALQVIILSHDKRFLCRIWNRSTHAETVALEIARYRDGSILQPWNVSEDSITEHDRRHMYLVNYVANGHDDLRKVAQSIRPHLEAFLRVAQPAEFRPETLVGLFVRRCREEMNGPNKILHEPAVQEISEILDYANRFHHDTNPAWETEEINDGELRTFVQRLLALTNLHSFMSTSATQEYR